VTDDNNDNQRTDRSQQYLPNERTFLSWVRTSIALIGLGFIISKFSYFLTEFRIIIYRGSIDAPELNSYGYHTTFNAQKLLNIELIFYTEVSINKAFFLNDNFRFLQGSGVLLRKL
jgi:putative membrane protein